MSDTPEKYTIDIPFINTEGESPKFTKTVINPTGNTIVTDSENEIQIPKSILKKKQSILAEAETLINGPRKDSYGPVEKSFNRIAELATIFTGHKLTGVDIAWIMIALKLGREISSHSRDNLVDLAGYTGLLGKLLKDE